MQAISFYLILQYQRIVKQAISRVLLSAVHPPNRNLASNTSKPTRKSYFYFSFTASMATDDCLSGYYYTNDGCYRSGWYIWGRWVVLVAIAVFIFTGIALFTYVPCVFMVQEVCLLTLFLDLSLAAVAVEG